MQQKKSLLRRVFETVIKTILISAKWNKYSPLQLAEHKEEKKELSHNSKLKNGVDVGEQNDGGQKSKKI